MIAIVASAAMVDRYELTGNAIREVFAQTPIPSWPGAGHVVVFDDCRYVCFDDSLPGTSVAAELTTDDVQRACLQIADQLAAEGWTNRTQAVNTDWCTVSLRKPAPLGRDYVIDLSISPDDYSTRPAVDPAHIAEPGRVFTGLRIERPAAVRT